jgi:hypothetical protein
MAIQAGRAVVYCVGEDGRDDRGQIEQVLGRDQGDVTLRMPVR